MLQLHIIMVIYLVEAFNIVIITMIENFHPIQEYINIRQEKYVMENFIINQILTK